MFNNNVHFFSICQFFLGTSCFVRIIFTPIVSIFNIILDSHNEIRFPHIYRSRRQSPSDKIKINGMQTVYSKNISCYRGTTVDDCRGKFFALNNFELKFY